MNYHRGYCLFSSCPSVTALITDLRLKKQILPYQVYSNKGKQNPLIANTLIADNSKEDDLPLVKYKIQPSLNALMSRPAFKKKALSQFPTICTQETFQGKGLNKSTDTTQPKSIFPIIARGKECFSRDNRKVIKNIKKKNANNNNDDNVNDIVNKIHRENEPLISHTPLKNKMLVHLLTKLELRKKSK